MERRDFVKLAGIGGASLALASPGKRLWGNNVPAEQAIRINPVPKFELSPWLYMQFMEPLGVTDSSVEAAWNHETDSWRKDVVEVTKELAPAMVRWGGLLSAYYKWKEAVVPGTGEFPCETSFGAGRKQPGGNGRVCRLLQAGGSRPAHLRELRIGRLCQMDETSKGEVRLLMPGRLPNGWIIVIIPPTGNESRSFKNPLSEIWQLGNETSYSKERFDLNKAAQKTIGIFQGDTAVDPSVRLIGWGDSGWQSK